MSERPNLTPEQAARHVRQHIDSLRAAGVEWVPLQGEAPEPTAAEVVQHSLFDAMPSPAPTPPAEAESPEVRRRELEVLAEQVSGCMRCPELASTRTQTVFGVGPVDVEVCFVGEAPGADEDRQGEPFVGAAGQLLNRIIAACGFRREDVYIMNTIKCRPPQNRPPLASETGNCREYFDRQLELVRPRFICALGGTAAQHILGTTTPISKLRGRFHQYKGIPLMCTFHPAFLLPSRSPHKKKDVWEDMKMLLTRMGRPIPEKA
jgi:DNA polymerase